MNNVFRTKKEADQAVHDKLAYAKFCADADGGNYKVYIDDDGDYYNRIRRNKRREKLDESLERHGLESIIKHIKRGLR